MHKAVIFNPTSTQARSLVRGFSVYPFTITACFRNSNAKNRKTGTQFPFLYISHESDYNIVTRSKKRVVMQLQLIRSIVILLATLVYLWGTALRADIEVLWLGHGTVRLTSETGKVIMIDAFLKKNPSTPDKYKEYAAIGKIDVILVTHGHIDHTDDLLSLAQSTGATVVANYEFANELHSMGALEDSKIIAMNKGGTVTPVGRDIKITMVPAEHSSSMDLWVFGSQLSSVMDVKTRRFLDGGAPVGYVIEFENEFTVYASGDTDVFGDMRLIKEFHSPDLALVCIGGHYTMGPEGAAYAMRELVKPKQVIPIHYGTYPVINRTPAELEAALGSAPIEVLAIKPGETIKF
jgi:L-ascorbate metabolism protein UlaG (beta-lactamase superfamily)